MKCAVSPEVLSSCARTWIIVEDAADGLNVIGCYEVSARRADYLAEQIVEANRGRVVVSVESFPRYQRKH